MESRLFGSVLLHLVSRPVAKVLLGCEDTEDHTAGRVRFHHGLRGKMPGA
jgi:hypothetical protein